MGNLYDFKTFKAFLEEFGIHYSSYQTKLHKQLEIDGLIFQFDEHGIIFDKVWNKHKI